MARYERTIGRNFVLRLDVNQGSRSISGNYSTVSWSLQLRRGNNPSWSQGTKTWSVNIGGVTRSGHRNGYDFRNTSSITLGSGSVRINHNSDGTKSINSSGNFGDPQGPIYNGSVSGGPLTLTSIPRASSISSSTASLDVNGTNTVSVGIARHSTSMTHDVRFQLGTQSHTITGVTTSTSYAIPASWLNQIPNSTSRAGTITLTTKSGSTTVGSTSKNFTARVPANIRPTAGSLTVTREDLTYPSSWNIFVQGQSSVRIRMTGSSGSYGSSISNSSVRIGNWVKAGNDVTFPISGSGDMTITGTVTDSRGRSATVTHDIYVEPYSPVEINTFSVHRSEWNGLENNNGTHGYISSTFTFTDLGPRRNELNVEVRYRSKGGAWTSWIPQAARGSNTSFAFGNGSLNPNNTYEGEFRIRDGVTEVVRPFVLGTSFVTMDFKNGGHGVAFGKVAELEDTFEVDFNARFNDDTVFHKGVEFRGPVTFNGPITFNNTPPFVERTRSGANILTPSPFSEMLVTSGDPVFIDVEHPTWYRFYYGAWTYISGNGIGEGRIGLQLSGATSKSPSHPTWGDVIRIYNNPGDRREFNIDYLLNPGVTQVQVMGYMSGSNQVTTNYQIFRAIPQFPGVVAPQ